MDDRQKLLERLAIDREADRPPERSWLPWASAAGALVAGLLLGWLIFGQQAGTGVVAAGASAQAPEQPAATETDAAAPAVDVAPAPTVPAAAPGERVLNASGYVVARLKATVSAQIIGRLSEVLVEEGMAVEAGQVVARLDDRQARINLDAARARLAAAEAALGINRANLAEAERVLKRVTALEARSFSSESELTRAEAEVERLKAKREQLLANVALARADVAQAQDQVDKHIIRAPFAGIVTTKNAQPGEIVAPTSAGGGFTRTGICTIVDMSSLEIEVDVNEAFISKVRPVQAVEARLDAYPDWAIPAHVIAIIPTANRDKATVRVRIGFDGLDPRILPEMGVNVAFLKTGT
ncbi:MAG: efflux RND transporter periplasmic adaptor subunit [Rhodothalassiaceae bacterium]